MLLKDKIAIVTGGTSGIGSAIVDELAREGAVVVFGGRHEARGKEVAKRVSESGGRCRFAQSDIAQPGVPDALVAEIMSKEGRIDVLVNNAGILYRGTVETTTDEEWERTFAVNVTALFRMSRAVVPFMRRLGGGAIVNIASDWALVAAHNAAAYGASKGAVAQLTRSMAIDHVKDGIRVNAVCPGDTDTPMLETAIAEVDRVSRLKQLGEAIPMGRVAEAREIAALVAFLASDKASYITGALIPIDGGNTAR